MKIIIAIALLAAIAVAWTVWKENCKVDKE